ncbi:hypothetical protein [Clostridium novyi]|nr:hypothetical protein [Clostridium novyi]
MNTLVNASSVMNDTSKSTMNSVKEGIEEVDMLSKKTDRSKRNNGCYKG